jgi:hypothetical protein
MADITQAFEKITNQENVHKTIEYFFTQRKINEEQEYLDSKTLNRKNKQYSVITNFVNIVIPNTLFDEHITGFDVEIFGDISYYYKAFMTNYEGTLPHFLIPLKGDKTICVKFLPKIEMKENIKYESEIFKRYITIISVPKRYQTVDNNNTGQIIMEDNDSSEESV